MSRELRKRSVDVPASLNDARKRSRPAVKQESGTTTSKPIECFDARNNKFLQFFRSTAAAAKLMHHSELKVRTACSSGTPFRGIIWRYSSGKYDLSSNVKKIEEIRALALRNSRSVKGLVSEESSSDSSDSSDSDSSDKERIKKIKSIRNMNSTSIPVACIYPIPTKITEDIADADDENADFHSDMNCKWIILKIFQSLSEAANALHVSTTTVTECCSGVRLYCGGLRWKFVSELPKYMELDRCMNALEIEDILNLKQLLFSSKLNQVNPIHYIFNRKVAGSKDSKTSDSKVRPTRSSAAVEYVPDRYTSIGDCKKKFSHLNESNILLKCITQAVEPAGYWTMESDKFKLHINAEKTAQWNEKSKSNKAKRNIVCIPNLSSAFVEGSNSNSSGERDNFLAKYGVPFNRTHFRSIGVDYQVDMLPSTTQVAKSNTSTSKMIHIGNFNGFDFLEQAQKLQYLCGAVVYWRAKPRGAVCNKQSKLVVVVANTYIHMNDTFNGYTLGDTEGFISVFDGKTSFKAELSELSWFIAEDTILEIYKDFHYKTADTFNYIQFLARERLNRKQWKYLDVFSYIQCMTHPHHSRKQNSNSQSENSMQRKGAGLLQMAGYLRNADLEPADIDDIWDGLVAMRSTLTQYEKDMERKIEQTEKYDLKPTYLPCPYRFSRTYQEFYEFHMFLSTEFLTWSDVKNMKEHEFKSEYISNDIPKEKYSNILSIFTMAEHMITMHTSVVTSAQIETIVFNRT